MIGCGYISREYLSHSHVSLFKWYINYESSVIVMYLNEWRVGGGYLYLLERW